MSEPAPIVAAQFASQRKDLLTLIDELRDIDVKNELDLPRIVVVGVSEHFRTD